MPRFSIREGPRYRLRNIDIAFWAHEYARSIEAPLLRRSRYSAPQHAITIALFHRYARRNGRAHTATVLLLSHNWISPEIQVIDVIVYFAHGLLARFGSRIPRIVDVGRDVNTVIRQPFSGAARELSPRPHPRPSIIGHGLHRRIHRVNLPPTSLAE